MLADIINVMLELGLMIKRMLGLKSDKNERLWHNREGDLVLKSEVWGEWRLDPDSYQNRYQDVGAVLWADREWLDRSLNINKRCLVYIIEFSKYKSSKSYDDSSGVRELYVSLKQSGKCFRFWHAKKASKTIY